MAAWTLLSLGAAVSLHHRLHGHHRADQRAADAVPRRARHRPLKVAQGLLIASPFYRDMNVHARAFTDRFTREMGQPPSFSQAGTYGRGHQRSARRRSETSARIVLIRPYPATTRQAGRGGRAGFFGNRLVGQRFAAAPDVAAAAKPCRNGCEPVCVRSAAAG
jgi:hypothetical protein